jgi:putative DNA primase/helicase
LIFLSIMVIEMECNENNGTGADRLPVVVTRYVSGNGPLAKRYDIVDGSVRKTPAAQMTRGTAERMRIDFVDLGCVLADADSRTALGYGCFGDRYGDRVRITVSGREQPDRGLLARTQAHFRYTPSPGIVMLDHDPHPRGRSYTPGGLAEAATRILGAVYARSARLERGSISAGVHLPGEAPRTGGGFHVYLPVLDASDIPRFGRVLFRRLWLAGYGYIAISSAGTFLARAPIDAAVFAPERLDFAGRPVLGAGIEWTPPVTEYHPGTYLDTRAIPDLTPDEEEMYAALVAAAKLAAEPERARVREEWIARQAKRMERRGAVARQAHECLRALPSDGDHHDLPETYVFDFRDLGPVTGSEILADPTRYDGAVLADPFEGPEYGRSTAIFYANIADVNPIVHSYAHGGCTYRVGSFPRTETGLARAYAYRHGLDHRYDHHAGAWHVWDGHVWARDDTRLAYDDARGLIRHLCGDVPQYSRASLVTAVERLAQADRVLATTSEQWDRDPWLLGTPGGTVDLRTGRMREPDPSDYITLRTSVAPADTAHAPMWDVFLSETAGEDMEWVRYVQRVCGYALTGSTREHVLLFAWGNGGNGKTTLVRVLTDILGGYARTAPMDMFCAGRGDRHPTELAMLRGARLVTATETADGRTWDDARLKIMTGGDRIAARYMHRDFFEYNPQFKVIVSGNAKPALRRVDDAMRRRLQLVPFGRQPETPDPDLGTKLAAEYPAILRWMIDGCLEWQRSGLCPPPCVRDASRTYCDEQDVLADFVAEHCEVGSDLYAATGDVYHWWRIYASERGEEVGTVRSLVGALSRYGCTSVRRTIDGRTVRCIRGLRLSAIAIDAAAACS